MNLLLRLFLYLLHQEDAALSTSAGHLRLPSVRLNQVREALHRPPSHPYLIPPPGIHGQVLVDRTPVSIGLQFSMLILLLEYGSPTVLTSRLSATILLRHSTAILNPILIQPPFRRVLVDGILTYLEARRDGVAMLDGVVCYGQGRAYWPTR